MSDHPTVSEFIALFQDFPPEAKVHVYGDDFDNGATIYVLGKRIYETG